MDVFIFFVIMIFVFIIISNLLESNKNKNDNIKRSLNKQYHLNEPKDNKNSESQKNGFVVERDGSSEIRFKITVSTTYDNENSGYKRYEKGYESQRENYRWIKPGELVEIGGFKITSGLFFYGKWMNSFDEYSVEPSLINTQCKIGDLEYEQERIDYWSSYSDLTKNQRAIYLNWLSKNKALENINIGYVFIFYYGLERRILEDLKDFSNQNKKEASVISQEIINLLKIYGNKSNSFLFYSSSFLNYIKYYFDIVDISDDLLQKACSDSYPLSFKIKLSKSLQKSEILSADLALEWIKFDVGYSLRTPAQRCPQEFNELFKVLYQRYFDQGIKLKENKSKIEIEYLPASRSIKDRYHFETRFTDYTKQTKHLAKLTQIANSTIDELEAFSRYIGRSNDSKESMKSLSLLPKELLINNKSGIIENIKFKIINKLQENAYVFLDLYDLLTIFSVNQNEPLKNQDIISINQFLAKLNIGIEPDIRFGSPKYLNGDKIILFRISDNFPTSPSIEYSATFLIGTVGIILSAADGTISFEELEFILNHIKNNLSLLESEINRIKYFILWAKESKLSAPRIINKLKNIRENQKEIILNFLLNLAHADGYVSPEEIDILKKVYRVFNQEESKLYSDIHNIQVGIHELPTVLKKDAEIVSYKIPSQEKAQFNIDNNKLLKTLHETEEVQGLLSSIFSEDEKELVEPILLQGKNDSIFYLDNKHSQLVRELLKKESWEENEFINLCETLELMPSGAIENINEAIFSKFKDDLIFEDEKYEINQNIIQEVLDEC